MPRVNIYIRVEDWDKWTAIENKPEWLHAHLKLNIGLPLPARGQLARYLYSTTTNSKGVLTEAYLNEQVDKAISLPPPKCEICGDYHFAYDPTYDCNKKPIEPNVTPSTDDGS